MNIFNRKYIIFINSAIFMLLSILNVIGFFFLKNYERELKNNFKTQIQHLSIYWENIFRGDELELIQPGMEFDNLSAYYQSLLADMKVRLQLQDVKILDTQKRILVDYSIDYEIGHPFQIDSLFWENSLRMNGKPVFREYKQNGKLYFQILLGIPNSDGKIVSVLYISMNPPLLISLQKFKSVITVINFSFILIIILMGFLSTYVILKFSKAQEEHYKKERLAQLGEMSAVIAHEIRNPLGIIKGSTNVLKKKIQDPSVKEMAIFIEEEINRLNLLITNLLQFVKKPNLTLTSFPIAELISDLVAQYQIQFSNINFNVQCANQLKIRGDFNALKQVLINIFQNAVHALEYNSSERIISISCQKVDKNVRIVIQNNGPAIPHHVLEKIFRPFFTTKEKGSGLGLAISRVLIENMQGTINITNLPDDKGVEVVILLPEGE